MHLISSPKSDIQLSSQQQNELVQLANSYYEQPTDINRLKLKEACQGIAVCLSYLRDDLMKRNWINVGILKVYDLLKGINIRIWQMQQSQIDVLAESLNNPNLATFIMSYTLMVITLIYCSLLNKLKIISKKIRKIKLFH